MNIDEFEQFRERFDFDFDYDYGLFVDSDFYDIELYNINIDFSWDCIYIALNNNKIKLLGMKYNLTYHTYQNYSSETVGPCADINICTTKNTYPYWISIDKFMNLYKDIFEFSKENIYSIFRINYTINYKDHIYKIGHYELTNGKIELGF